LPAFKAKTLDVKSVPRKKEDLLQVDDVKDEKKNVRKKKFMIENYIDIKEIMKSQSTGRRKLANEQ